MYVLLQFLHTARCGALLLLLEILFPADSRGVDRYGDVFSSTCAQGVRCCIITHVQFANEIRGIFKHKCVLAPRFRNGIITRPRTTACPMFLRGHWSRQIVCHVFQGALVRVRILAHVFERVFVRGRILAPCF